METQSIMAINLKYHRKAAGLSQEQLGLKAGLGRTYIGDLERAEGNPTIKSLQKIMDALHLKPEDLFCEASEDASVRTSKLDPFSDNAPETHYSICKMEHGRYHFIPIDVEKETLSVKVIAELVERGYTGDELASRYSELMAAIFELAGKTE